MLPALWLKEAPVTNQQAKELALASTLADWGHMRDVEVNVPAATARGHLDVRFLHYGLPNDLTERKIAITQPRGVLDRLRVLSELLHDRYAWTAAQATIFVVTGAIPLVATLSVEMHGHGRLPALGRIQLTIDPALSPMEVADQYALLRRNFVGPRHRELIAKHVALAIFSSTRPQGEPWAVTMAEWNSLYEEGHPDWLYTVPNTFGRDVTAARRRLLGQTETLTSKGEGHTTQHVQ
jgi:hypothetical protein